MTGAPTATGSPSASATATAVASPGGGSTTSSSGAPAGGVPAQTGTGSLANTGSETPVLTAAAGLLTAVGAAAVFVARRRRVSAPGRHR
ncbi:LPXTG cell wall anchor domain-containing protein [Kitasatospora sp. NPDC097605]|uniref:LPXTG cell wall anchor domain-containing protein n=1 Tax=Kitasatospora sp. NPDC097605 TaxID=3157226 RepID=UPI0033319CDA